MVFFSLVEVVAVQISFRSNTFPYKGVSHPQVPTIATCGPASDTRGRVATLLWKFWDENYAELT